MDKQTIVHIATWATFVIAASFCTHKIGSSRSSFGRKTALFLASGVLLTVLFGLGRGLAYFVLCPMLLLVYSRRTADARHSATINGMAPRRSTNGGVGPERTMEVFTQRAVWKSFPPSFLQALAAKLGSPSRATEFAQFCERIGILQSNIVGYDLHEPAWGVGETTNTLSSYAYKMAQSNRYAEAREAWDFALLLGPRHVPAWIGMAILSFNEQDCKAATFWADKVLSYRPNPNSNDPIEIAGAQLMAGEGEHEAAEAFDDPGIVGSTNEAIKQMQEIKSACRGR